MKPKEIEGFFFFFNSPEFLVLKIHNHSFPVVLWFQLTHRLTSQTSTSLRCSY